MFVHIQSEITYIIVSLNYIKLIRSMIYQGTINIEDYKNVIYLYIKYMKWAIILYITLILLKIYEKWI